MKTAPFLALACTLSFVVSGCASSRNSAAAHNAGHSPFWASAETPSEHDMADLTGWTVRPISDSP